MASARCRHRYSGKKISTTETQRTQRKSSLCSLYLCGSTPLPHGVNRELHLIALALIRCTDRMRVEDAEEHFEFADGERHLRAEACVDGEVASAGEVAVFESSVSGAGVRDRVGGVEVDRAESEVAIAED